MDLDWQIVLKRAIHDALKQGVTFPDLLMCLYHTAVDWALVKTRGNQTKAANLIVMSRHCIGKYAHRKGTPMGVRSFKEGPCQDRRKTSSK